MKKLWAVPAVIVAACGQQAGKENAPAPTPAVTPSTNEAVASKAPVAPDRTAPPTAKPVLIEPKGPIDPKSVEAAGQVVQQYGALIEQNRIAEAAALWSNSEAAAAFAKELKPATHLEIGELGATEGAAGSIYTTMPVVFYRDDARRPANIVLRRVNDVPGSTEAQRRWHIDRVEWKRQ